MLSVSTQNITNADYARIETIQPDQYAVSLWRNGKSAFLYDENGLMLFPNYFCAFNAVFKVRSDLPFDQHASSAISI